MEISPSTTIVTYISVTTNNAYNYVSMWGMSIVATSIDILTPAMLYTSIAMYTLLTYSVSRWTKEALENVPASSTVSLVNR